MAFRRHLIALLCLMAAALGAAAQEPSQEMQRRVKAAFVYKFAAFIEWPEETFASAASPIVIGVAGAEVLANELEQAVVGREVGGRPVVVRRIKAGALPADCCQILFVGAGLRDQASALLLQVASRPVLTVTESQGEPPAGSVINFVQVDDRVRFDISREAAEVKRLKLRSQLLAVARLVVSP